jgi:hypothetical protein
MKDFDHGDRRDSALSADLDRQFTLPMDMNALWDLNSGALLARYLALVMSILHFTTIPK